VEAEEVAEEVVVTSVAKVEPAKKATEDSAGSGSSPIVAVRTKRAATLGGSTPPPKRFRDALRPRYAK
jgi:hypothetical protein